MKTIENTTEINKEELQERAEKMLVEIIKQPEVSEALDLLNNLPSNLKYHDKNHTIDVLKETILFSLADNIDNDTLMQQIIAAAWHDVGFTESETGNEAIAVVLFKQSETYKKLSNEHRDEIIASILDSQVIIVDKIPSLGQSRSNFGYMLDADVSNFGREDFFDKLKLVAKEQNIDLNDYEQKKIFYKFVINLFINHEWITGAAYTLRQEQKEINLQKLEEEYLSI